MEEQRDVEGQPETKNNIASVASPITVESTTDDAPPAAPELTTAAVTLPNPRLTGTSARLMHAWRRFSSGPLRHDGGDIKNDEEPRTTIVENVRSSVVDLLVTPLRRRRFPFLIYTPTLIVLATAIIFAVALGYILLLLSWWNRFLSRARILYTISASVQGFGFFWFLLNDEKVERKFTTLFQNVDAHDHEHVNADARDQAEQDFKARAHFLKQIPIADQKELANLLGRSGSRSCFKVWTSIATSILIVVILLFRENGDIFGSDQELKAVTTISVFPLVFWSLTGPQMLKITSDFRLHSYIGAWWLALKVDQASPQIANPKLKKARSTSGVDQIRGSTPAAKIFPRGESARIVEPGGSRDDFSKLVYTTALFLTRDAVYVHLDWRQWVSQAKDTVFNREKGKRRRSKIATSIPSRRSSSPLSMMPEEESNPRFTWKTQEHLRNVYGSRQGVVAFFLIKIIIGSLPAERYRQLRKLMLHREEEDDPKYEDNDLATKVMLHTTNMIRLDLADDLYEHFHQTKRDDLPGHHATSYLQLTLSCFMLHFLSELLVRVFSHGPWLKSADIDFGLWVFVFYVVAVLPVSVIKKNGTLAYRH